MLRNNSEYVDDLVLFHSSKNMNDMKRTLQTGINELMSTADRNGFRFSTEKTQCVHFCRLRKPHNDPQLFLKGSPIECKESNKFLGLILDSKLTWGPYIDDLSARCKKALNIIRCVANINWVADREVLLNLYRSLVLSRIDYGCMLYASARKTRLHVLESIQCT